MEMLQVVFFFFRQSSLLKHQIWASKTTHLPWCDGTIRPYYQDIVQTTFIPLNCLFEAKEIQSFDCKKTTKQKNNFYVNKQNDYQTFFSKPNIAA
jgi:hypothetical protein